MRLEIDCVRECLLFLEDHLLLNGSISHTQIKVDGYSQDEITYTLSKLSEGGLINGKPRYADNKIHFFNISSITYEGHKVLDNIRDNGVFKETKNALSKFSSVSIDIFVKVASQVLSNMISNQLGIK